MTRSVCYRPSELLPYVNWTYFFHAWGLAPRYAAAASLCSCAGCREGWVGQFSAPEQAAAREALRLHDDAAAMLKQMETEASVRALVGLYAARADGDDIVLRSDAVGEVRLPFLRQQQPTRPGEPCLCWADFVSPQPPAPAEAPLSVAHTVGLFVTAADAPMPTDDYGRLLQQTLCDRLAEAAAEHLHEEVRRCDWGYAPSERLAPADLFAEKFQGARPAVGYPSLPDQSLIFLIDKLLRFEQIGVSLTQTGMMQPHAAVCGLYFAHPAARHFGIGPIDEEQLLDYARRRGLPGSALRPYLSRNLASSTSPS